MSLAPEIIGGTVVATWGAIMGGVGWLIARRTARGDQRESTDVSQRVNLALLGRRVDELCTDYPRDLAELGRRHDADITELKRRLEHDERRAEAQGQELAALGWQVTDHVTKHPRNGGG